MAKPITDTGWKPITPTDSTVDNKTEEVVGAGGRVAMVTGGEEKPCCMCTKWDHVDTNRIVRHLLSKGLKPREDGKFETPIAKDYKGRKSLVLDPVNFGYCRKDTVITESLATCPAWTPTRTVSEFQQRMRSR